MVKILHITRNSNGYEEVELVANRINYKNSFALILKDGEERMTGGYLIHDTPEIRAALDSIPRDKQYAFVEMFKRDPWVKAYHEEY